MLLIVLATFLPQTILLFNLVVHKLIEAAFQTITGQTESAEAGEWRRKSCNTYFSGVHGKNWNNVTPTHAQVDNKILLNDRLRVLDN